LTSLPYSGDSGEFVTRLSHAIIFANRQAGGGKPVKLLSQCEQVFRQTGVAADIRITASLGDLEDQALKAIASGAKLLFAAGGDGTLQGLVNAAFGHDVVLGVVPAGGGNDFARALGLPRNPMEALRAALQGQPQEVDLARVRFGDGRQRLFLGGGGIGLDADAAKFSGGAFRNWPGRTRYIASAICAYARYRPGRVRIDIDSEGSVPSWQVCVLASVLNTPTFGAGIRLSPGARINDGLLDFVFLGELPVGRLLFALPQLALRGTLNLPNLRAVRFRRMCIETETTAYFHGDGELLGPTPIDIEVVPKAARFLAPKPKES